MITNISIVSVFVKDVDESKQRVLVYLHHLKAGAAAAELLAGDAATYVEQMVLGVVQCVSDDGGRVDHLILRVDSDHDLLFSCE